MADNPYRIMSFDGGGIRAVLTATWLSRLEKELNGPIGKHVDLLAGTSTGSILAAALASGQRAEQIVALYKDVGREVFPSTASRIWSRIRRTMDEGLSQPKYDGAGLEGALIDLFGEQTKLSDLSIPTMITAYDTFNRQGVVFKSWKEEHAGLPLWEVVKSSCSAPTYFPAHIVTVENAAVPLIDGGVLANNPAMCAIAEGVKLGRRQNTGRTLLDLHVASFGTGEATRPIPAEDATEWGLLEWAKPIVSVLMDGPCDAVDYAATQILPQDQYVRWQTRLDTAYDDLDNATKTNINALMSTATGYLNTHAGETALRRTLELFK